MKKAIKSKVKPVKTEKEAEKLAQIAAASGPEKLAQDLKTAARLGDRLLVKALIAKGATVIWKDANGATALIESINRGDCDLVLTLLKNGAQPSGVQGFHTPLVEALYGNNIEIATVLLNNGANPNEADKLGTRPLIFAAKKASEPMIRLLLDHGAEINVMDRDGRTSLFWAEKGQSKNIIALLNKKGASSAKVEISLEHAFKSTAKDDLNELKNLLNSGLDVNGRGTLETLRRTLLMEAAANGSKKCAAHLLTSGADVNAIDAAGESALFHAARQGDLGLVNLLTEAGIKVNGMDNRGWTALMWAAFEGQMETTIRLLELGAAVNHKSESGDSALIAACQNKKYSVARALIKAGAKINQQDASGRSAMMYAIRDLPFVKFLVNHGADVKIKDSDGDTAIDIAKRLKLKNVMEYLKKLPTNQALVLQQQVIPQTCPDSECHSDQARA